MRGPCGMQVERYKAKLIDVLQQHGIKPESEEVRGRLFSNILGFQDADASTRVAGVSWSAGWCRCLDLLNPSGCGPSRACCSIVE